MLSTALCRAENIATVLRAAQLLWLKFHLTRGSRAGSEARVLLEPCSSALNWVLEYHT